MDAAGFTADELAQRALKAVAAKKLYVVHGARARWLWRLKRLMPVTFLRWASRVFQELPQEQSAHEPDSQSEQAGTHA
jgi:hypothetical protein